MAACFAESKKAYYFPSLESYNKLLSVSLSSAWDGSTVAYGKLWTPLCSFCSKTEKALNNLSHLSFVSTGSSLFRMLYGQALTIISLAMAIFFGVCWGVSGNISFKCDMIDWTKYFLHGGVNIIRSIIEFIPMIGSDLCYGYDFLGCRLEY